eukprot:6185860-Pleurochrysis_carterae.AAC.4
MTLTATNNKQRWTRKDAVCSQVATLLPPLLVNLLDFFQGAQIAGMIGADGELRDEAQKGA